MSFQVGDTVGTYRIIKRLGGGGMGEVYQVEHTVTGRMEALKVLATDDLKLPISISDSFARSSFRPNSITPTLPRSIMVPRKWPLGDDHGAG